MAPESHDTPQGRQMLLITVREDNFSCRPDMVSERLYCRLWQMADCSTMWTYGMKNSAVCTACRWIHPVDGSRTNSFCDKIACCATIHSFVYKFILFATKSNKRYGSTIDARTTRQITAFLDADTRMVSSSRLFTFLGNNLR